uniref:Uncharacterized protein n=1 Tax=Romanomermis culicivorax TaxID=13658 RepID=A0A915K339_ROMCU
MNVKDRHTFVSSWRLMKDEEAVVRAYVVQFSKLVFHAIIRDE